MILSGISFTSCSSSRTSIPLEISSWSREFPSFPLSPAQEMHWMGPGEDGTGPLDLGASWVSLINTYKTQFLTPLLKAGSSAAPNTRTLSHSRRLSSLPPQIQSVRKSYWLDLQSTFTFCLPPPCPQTDYFSTEARGILLKPSQVLSLPLLHTLCCSHLTQGKS